MTTSQWPAQEAPDDPPRASAQAASNAPVADGQPANTDIPAYLRKSVADSVAGPAAPGQLQPMWVRPPPTAAPTQAGPGTGWQPTLPPPNSPTPAPASPPPHKWGFGAFLLAQGVFLAISAIVVLGLSSLRMAKPGAPPPGAALVISLAVPTVLAALAAIMITRWRGNGPIADLRLKVGWRDVGIGIACGVIGVIVTIPAGMLWSNWVGEKRAYSAVGKVFDGIQLNPGLAVLVFFIVWLLAPLCEEILYRGLLWGAMERRAWNRWIMLVIVTVVFALAHGEPWRAPLLLVIGLPMGVARMLSRGLPAAVIAHQINNFLPALGLMLLLLGVPLTNV